MIEEENNEPTISNSLLIKLYDQTGTTNCSHKGFIMFYVNEAGEPAMIGKFENAATQMALQTAVETFLENHEHSAE